MLSATLRRNPDWWQPDYADPRPVTTGDRPNGAQSRRSVMEQPLRSGPFGARRTVFSVTTLADG
jgi:hypothetical protein